MVNQEIITTINLDDHNHHVGSLWHSNKNDATTFQYDASWLNNPLRFALEPSLRLDQGKQHTKGLFGAFNDSSPDRWGRELMQYIANEKSKEAGKKPYAFREIDYLLGVNDYSRLGALRFSYPQSPEIFLAEDTDKSIPPIIKLGELMDSSTSYQNKKATNEQLRLLFAPGTSLGGARPKATIFKSDQQLAIAKFHKTDDSYSVIAWEAVATQLAKQAGITVPEFELKYIDDKPILLLTRFDRVKSKRIPFLSAQSMLQALPQETHYYTEIMEAIVQYGESPTEDIQQLWRRMVFNILIANTDDHLRNHGFLFGKHSWRLAPAYDLNPTPLSVKDRTLTTKPSPEYPASDLSSALKTAKDFRLDIIKANKIIDEIKHSISQWKTIAMQQFNIDRKECDEMQSAFLIH